MAPGQHAMLVHAGGYHTAEFRKNRNVRWKAIMMTDPSRHTDLTHNASQAAGRCPIAARPGNTEPIRHRAGGAEALPRGGRKETKQETGRSRQNAYRGRNESRDQHAGRVVPRRSPVNGAIKQNNVNDGK